MRLSEIVAGAAVVCLLLALLTWLLVRGISTDSANYAAMLRLFDDFALAEASLHRDVLEARAGLLQNYDPLNASMAQIDSAVAQLRSKASNEGLDVAPVDRLAAATGREEELTERFKTDNALLRNSLSYVGLLSTNPDFVERNPLLAPSVGALAAAILQLTLDSSPQSSQAVQNRLVELVEQTPAEGPDERTAQAFIAHARSAIPARTSASGPTSTADLVARRIGFRGVSACNAQRDSLPGAPAPRLGTPQARHTHGLLAGGCRALEHLFPGIELDLVEAGAVRMRLRRDMRFEVPGFDPLPQRDFGFDQFLLSRPALELVCRRRVEREPNIEFKPRSRVTELIASPDSRGVAGVRFEDTRGAPGNLAADLVVDASGRASPTLRFLDAIGSAKPTATEIGIDQAYATAVFETPGDAPTDWLGVVHAPTPPGSSRLGIILPMEGRRWSVSLCVNHGEASPSDIDGFMAFAKSFRMPTIYNAIRSAKRVGDIARFGMPCSVLRAFDKLDCFPRGLVPIGDSVCRFPPVQGQGMSVAAQEAHVLASLFESRRERGDPLYGLAEAFFREIQPLLEAPWTVAINDLLYPQTRGERPPDFETRLQYGRALMRLAAEDPETDRILFEVRSLLRPQSALREPRLASRVKAMMATADLVSPTRYYRVRAVDQEKQH